MTLKGKTMTKRHEIRTRGAKGSLWGWSQTLDKARQRAAKLSRQIRSDMPVCIVVDGDVIEQSSTSSVFTGQPRPTMPIQE